MIFRNPKYIIVETVDGDEIPFIFPNHIQHNRVPVIYDKSKVVAAGFLDIDIDLGIFRAFGESRSIGVKSRPEDTDLIKKLLLKTP